MDVCLNGALTCRMDERPQPLFNLHDLNAAASEAIENYTPRACCSLRYGGMPEIPSRFLEPGKPDLHAPGPDADEGAGMDEVDDVMSTSRTPPLRRRDRFAQNEVLRAVSCLAPSGR